MIRFPMSPTALIATSLLVLSLNLLHPAPTTADLASDRAALLALSKSLGGRSLLWNLTDSVCSWTGVICVKDQVVELHLPGTGLSGQLPDGVLGNLTQLQTLSLRFNALSGTIPPDISKLSSLEYLYLQGNIFTGDIPNFLFSLTNLVRLNLASNNFSGEISPAVNKLTNLKTLYLAENQLSGSLPDLTIKLDQFNVSSNKLTGSVPVSLATMPKSSLEGNTLCGLPLKSCKGSSGLSGGAIAGIAIGCVIVFLLLLLILIFLCRRKSKKSDTTSRDVKTVEGGVVKQREIEISQEKTVGGPSIASASAVGGGGEKRLVFFGKEKSDFDLEDLLRASAEVLGKGTFGTTYKATLEMRGALVAVKRLKDVAVPEMEFREKMKEIGQVEHQNLVALRAYYFNKDEKLLVYEYMPTGSLSALLHGNTVAGRTPLNWDTRASIAVGSSRAIGYLHSQSPTTSHGNIKSSNILLTKSYEARVSDFGLAHVSIPTATPNRIDGYRAPEVTDTQRVSQKADVYSFGVLLLELLTGKPPTHSQLNEEGVDLPRWVHSVVKEEWTSEVFDMELLRYQDVEEDMVQLLQLALECTSHHPDNRPTMEVVGKKIEEIIRSGVKEEEEEEEEVDDGSNLS